MWVAFACVCLVDGPTVFVFSEVDFGCLTVCFGDGDWDVPFVLAPVEDCKVFFAYSEVVVVFNVAVQCSSVVVICITDNVGGDDDENGSDDEG